MTERSRIPWRHRVGSTLLALSGFYLVVWAIGLPDWWRPSQSLAGLEVPTVALALPWAALTLLGAFLRYQDQPEAER